MDGSTVASDGDDNGNQTIWTNYNNSQAGDNTAEIVFEYATQQRFAEFVIHFYRDGYSARYPEAGTTKIQVSENGTSWTDLEATETIGEEVGGNITPYTYSFEPTLATFVKFIVTNKEETLSGRNTCTGISEIELKVAVSGASGVYSSTALTSLEVNGVAASASDLASGTIYTTDTFVDVTAASDENAAITVLPAYENVVRVITEAEDHSARATYLVMLGQEKPIDPSDDSRDYPVADITYSTGSAQPQSGDEGPIEFAFDGDEDTYWHSEWTPSWYGTSNCANYLWVEFDLAEATVVDAIRYLPRSGNGDITGYRVEAKTADSDTWTTLTSGTWERDGEWKLAEFEATEVTALRLVATATYADSANNKFASARELRVRTADTSSTPVAADKTALNAAIKEAEVIENADYTEASWKAFETALANAKTVSAKENASQGEVDKVLADLNKAVEGLTVYVPAPVENPFTDINESQYYYDPILWAYTNGITDGATDTTFDPEGICTRGQVVTFLYRAAGSPEVKADTCKFTDVKAGDYYYNAVLWAVEKGITDGTSDTKFAPDVTCLRGQVVTFLYRYANL